MSLSWNTTLKEYRETIISNTEYKKYFKNIFNALEKNEKKKEFGVQKNTFHFAMAVLLGGTGQIKDTARGVYVKEIFGQNKTSTSWTRSAGSFIHTKKGEESDAKLDLKKEDNSKLRRLDEGATIDQAIEWIHNEGLGKISDEKYKELKRMVGILLKKEKLESDGEAMDFEEQIKNLINNGVNQIILTGAPGTGKTFIAKRIANSMGKELNWKKDKDDSLMKYEFVQFHPSYDYTDFVEGLRPVEVNGNVTFKKVDGIFKAFCRKVIENKNNGQDDGEYYFFIIDEINRADLSKVLGELMYGLEKDKRGQQNKINTQYQNLPTFNIDTQGNIDNSELGDVFKEGFYIPENIIIIGTMNDIDRSVESMDFALRRRFEWKEFIVEKDMLKNSFEQQREDETYAFGEIIYKNADKLADRIMCLNGVIEKNGASFSLNRQYFISQGYFSNLPKKVDEYNFEEIDDIIKYVWKYRLETLIREYVRGENTVEVEKFIEQCQIQFMEI